MDVHVCVCERKEQSVGKSIFRYLKPMGIFSRIHCIDKGGYFKTSLNMLSMNLFF